VSEKLSRKELKQPDAFVKAGSVARGWFQENVRLVTIAVGVAVLAVGGAVLADYVHGKSEDEASRELGGKLKIMDRPVSESATTTGDDAPFKTAQERDEAVIKGMEELRSKYGGTKAARTAWLVAAAAQLRERKFDDALKGYTEYLKETKHPEEPMRASAMEGQGYAYEGKGELDRALAAFEQLERENKTDFLTGMGLYHRGRILALQGKKEDAARAFLDVQNAHANTGAAKLAQARLTELKAQGVAIPEPAPKPAATPDAG
jgi:predicted negative regulator of RcsB-dependent stress response